MIDTDELQSLDVQIAQLQAKKQSILDSKRSHVLEETRSNIKRYGFTLRELGLSSSSVVKHKQSTHKEAKYINPDNSHETWHGGKGPKPKWVRAQLNIGKTLEDLLIRR